jgi:hypothetical protein
LILLDENALASQRAILESKRLPVRKVGGNWGRSGMSDEEILAELQRTRRATFLTRDARLYRDAHCHPNYCLAVVAAPANQLAAYAIRFLRHRSFRTHSRRMGKVIRVQPTGIVYWERHSTREIEVPWV